MDAPTRTAWRRLPRWLIPALAALVGTVTGISLLLAAQSGGTAACAAPAGSGRATYYLLSGEGGNCSYPGPPADSMYVALGPAEYAAGARCGGYLDVTGPKGTVRVKVVDKCPECEPGHLDLSREAFARIGAVVDGIIPITYRAVVNPPLPAPLSFRFKEGSSAYWLGLLVIDHGNPLSAVRVTGSAGTKALQRADYNYWLAEQGTGPGPFTVQVTDTAGHQVSVPGVPLRDGQTVTSGVRMYPGSAPKATAAPARPTSPAPASSPAASPSAAPLPSSSESVEAFVADAPSGGIDHAAAGARTSCR